MKKESKEGISRKTFLKQVGLGFGALGTGIFFPGSLSAASFLSGSTNNPKNVVVVGAGLAGLAAARELKANGHQVTILEARNRPGGRVSTLREPFPDGIYAEEGAAAYSDSYTEALKLINEFKFEKIPWAMPEEGIVYHLNGKRIVSKKGEAIDWPYELSAKEKGKDPFALVQMYIIDTLPKETGMPDLWDKAPVVNFDKTSLADYLRKQGASEGAIKLLQNTMWFAAVPEGTSGLSMAMSDFGFFMGGMPFILKGGNDLLPKEMAKQMKGELHYGVEVKTVEDLEEKVVISAVENGKNTTYEADEVIVTLPLKVLKNVTFKPALSAAKSKAIEGMPVLNSTRVFIEVDKPFWREEGVTGLVFSDLPLMNVNAYHNAKDPENGAAMLESYVVGERAEELGEMGEQEAIEQQLQEMKKVYPEVQEHFTEGYVKAWSEDPYALGGPSWPGPGDVTAYLKDLQSPHGKIHFAGEHTSILRSTMEGALRSGIRAAQEVQES
ncbi:FAD-dependent oxidoreductase [Salinimicrobium sp. CDJ15-81-2]|nr:FAD-dependent oxidoreductase [Salinimicrobium nanhaiense]